MSLLPLQNTLLALFQSPYTDNIIRGIAFIGFLQLLQLILPHLAGIAHDMGKIGRIVVFPHGNIRHLHTGKLTPALLDLRHAFIGNVFHNCRGEILLVGCEPHGIEDVDHVQNSGITGDNGIAVVILHLVKMIALFGIIEDGLRILAEGALRKILLIAAVGLGNEAALLGFGAGGEAEAAVAVHRNLVLPLQRILILFYDLRQLLQHAVTAVDAALCRIEGIGIRDGNVVLQGIVGQKLSVPVIDISAGAGSGGFRQNPLLILLQVFIAVQNLQLKKLHDQNGKQCREGNGQSKKPGRKNSSQNFSDQLPDLS